MVLHLLTYGPMLLAIKRQEVHLTVHATHHQVPVLHHMLAAATTVSLDHQTILILSSNGTPVIPCGMECNVEEMRDHVVTLPDYPGLTRTHPHPPLPLSMCVSVWIRLGMTRTLELSVWSSLSNNYLFFLYVCLICRCEARY